jgi:hypothetical protein
MGPPERYKGEGVIHLRKALLVASVAFMVVAGLGCGTRESKVLAPEESLSRAGDPTADDGAVKFRKYQVVYTECGTFTLDYPSDFVGPIPDGHARIGTPRSSLCP